MVALQTGWAQHYFTAVFLWLKQRRSTKSRLNEKVSLFQNFFIKYIMIISKIALFMIKHSCIPEKYKCQDTKHCLYSCQSMASAEHEPGQNLEEYSILNDQ